jgi:hypothetical protein
MFSVTSSTQLLLIVRAAPLDDVGAERARVPGVCLSLRLDQELAAQRASDCTACRVGSCCSSECVEIHVLLSSCDTREAELAGHTIHVTGACVSAVRVLAVPGRLSVMPGAPVSTPSSPHQTST